MNLLNPEWSIKFMLRDCFFPLSHWERVRVRGFHETLGPLTPALSRGEREPKPLLY